MSGYIYCLSNESMPGLLKIGRTMRTPEERVKELYSTGVPTPFKIEFAKKVADVVQKERFLHILLGKYTLRIPSREFFKTDTATVKEFFDLMDGEDWVSEYTLLTETAMSPEKPKKSPAKGRKNIVMETEIVCPGKTVSIHVEPTTPEKLKKVITAVYKKRVEDV
jgi:hypothetical protein